MENAISNFFISASSKGLFLYYLVADNVPRCLFGDSTRLQQIVSHLISNAIKFTTTGGVIVRVTCGASESASSSSNGPVTLFIEVEDSGVGIPSEKFNLLFQRFSTLHDDTQTGGTGLGLALCKKVAQKMGGDVFLKGSVPNKGSTFSIRLPMKIGAMSFCDAPFLRIMQDLHVEQNSLPVVGCALKELSFDFLKSVCESMRLRCDQLTGIDQIPSWISKLPGKNGIVVCDLSVCLEWTNPDPNIPVVLLLPPHHLAQRRLQASSSPEAQGSATANGRENTSLDRIPKSFLRLLLPIRRMALFETVLKARNASRPDVMDVDTVEEELQPKDLKDLKVIIVEDNKVNQKVLCKMLNSVNIQPTVVVENGLKSVQFFEQAFQAGNAKPADLVFMVRHFSFLYFELTFCRTFKCL
jgi:hypothetical protein